MHSAGLQVEGGLRPPPPQLHPLLSGSAVGSCLVSEDNSWNLGVVQISPQAAANGSLSIVYVNGDKCGNQRFSTRIMFECAQTSVRVQRPGVSAGAGRVPSSRGLLLEARCAFMAFRPPGGFDQKALFGS